MALIKLGAQSRRNDYMLQVKVKSLSDYDSYYEEENISENGDKEGYLFSSK